ncbi:hypothetical protein [Bradyrhizobium australafricanum]|uniref:hypothetical protein n=1 Tax=Bradyrhizobium australafricanum TaxID=2821406 RepID=UPI001CE32C24|nr:hypothetical protein [Bradyrhizobium australafricanum]MCA6098174.1 hypothetical protein [Bradyrhizobium australafricanum]
MPALTRRQILAGAAATAAIAAMPASAITEVVLSGSLELASIAACDGDYWIDQQTGIVWNMIEGEWHSAGISGNDGPVGC